MGKRRLIKKVTKDLTKYYKKFKIVSALFFNNADGGCSVVG